MPPIPSLDDRPRRRTRSGPDNPAGQDRKVRGDAPSGSGSASSSSRAPRTTKAEVKIETLKKQVDQTYTFVGLAMSPLGRFVPILGPLGYSMRKYSDELADAWIELALEDAKVLKKIEDYTSASKWGRIAGVHAAMFADALPKSQEQQRAEQMEANRQASYQEQMEMADTIRNAQTGTFANIPTRDTSTGGPGDTIRVNPDSFQAQKVAEMEPIIIPSAAAMPLPTPTTPKSAAIVTPEQLGVTNVPTTPPTMGSSSDVAGEASKSRIVSPEELGIEVPGEQGQYNFPASPPPNGNITNG